jgi:GT2 family glycosyltransferase
VPAAIALVVVNFNSGPLLAKCLAALARQTFREFEVIVLDNASTDSSALAAEQIWPIPITLIRAPTNLGFAAGVNRAVRHAGPSRWLALLNPDAFPDADWLEHLVSAAERYPGSASFASRQLMAERPDLFDGAGDVYHTCGMAWRAFHGQPVPDALEPECEVFSACAAAALYRRDVFEAIGGLDEDFFCYLEDVDIGFRLRLAGWECRYVPFAVVSHVGSATSGRRSDFMTYHAHRNLVWVFVKNMPGSLFWRYTLQHIALTFVEFVVCTTRGQGQAILRSKLDALRGMGGAWRKRRVIQAARKCSLADIHGALQHGWPRRFSR